MPCSPCCPHCCPQSKADTQFIGHGICTSASTSCTAVSEDEVHVPPPRQKQKSRQVSEVQHALASSQLDTAPCDREVKNQQQQTAAEVAAAAGVVAAAAALQVIQAAGEQVEAQLQVHSMCTWHTLCKGFLHLAHRLNLANSVSSSSDSCCCTAFNHTAVIADACHLQQSLRSTHKLSAVSLQTAKAQQQILLISGCMHTVW